jgi:hypothetical protein
VVLFVGYLMATVSMDMLITSVSATVASATSLRTVARSVFLRLLLLHRA